MAQVKVTIARTDGKRFDTRNAQIESRPLTFINDTATVPLQPRNTPYQLVWIVTGKPGDYRVQITAPPEAVDPVANGRTRKIDADGFGAGQRRFSVTT